MLTVLYSSRTSRSDDHVDAAIQRVLEHTGFIMGKEVTDFEQAFAQYVGAKSAVGVASVTAALQLSLLACGVGAGDEVITTAHTFIATAEAIWQVGTRPVFVDINPRTYNIDPNCVGDAITVRTKGYSYHLCPSITLVALPLLVWPNVYWEIRYGIS